ncbi:hypothetical protein VTN77DRAFT_4492 [Rasamsonia byssochlamydoides]|uniref:uncharacterized protein n=1 Tax=Rasamsonia byssochlamydoides TaxID=89139 RepID=UPI0037441463
MAAMSVQKCIFSLLTLLAVLDSPTRVGADSPKVVKMDISRRSSSSSSSSTNHAYGRLARRNTVNVVVNNAVFQGLYFVNATVGTPPQPVQLQIDTGSSDVWVFGPNSCDENTSPCLGGVFDPSESSSIKVVGKDEFKIEYGTPNSDVVGNYITDDFGIGGITIKNLTMAVATDAKVVPTGIMGIGFDTDESLVAQGSKPYPNIIDVMVEQGLISTRAYSLWLNDLDSSTGNVLFGGYDTDKFSGKLLTLPIQPDAQTGNVSTMTVAWTSLSVTNSSGSDGVTKTITPDNFAEAALLDSGTTVTLLPTDLYEELAQFFGAVEDPYSGATLVDCDLLDSSTGTLNFGFGGSGGPVIKVPFSEFALPLEYEDGSLACQLGIQPLTEPDLGVILGDTFLRSAYVVYDLDNKQISLAQTVFNSTSSNVVEMKASSSVGTLVSGVTVTQTATGLQAPGFQASATDMPSVTLSETALQFTGTALATGTSSGSDKSGAASSAVVPGTFASVAVCMLAMVLGTALMTFH